jgi:hypothetical protein
MPVLVQFDFPYEGPFGEAMVSTAKDLAQSIATEPGLIWKIWTENAENREAGGIYLFQDRAAAEAYTVKHTARLKQFGITKVNAKLFDVNAELSRTTRAPL